jgi:hypothetical protein
MLSDRMHTLDEQLEVARNLKWRYYTENKLCRLDIFRSSVPLHVWISDFRNFVCGVAIHNLMYLDRATNEWSHDFWRQLLLEPERVRARQQKNQPK